MTITPSCDVAAMVRTALAYAATYLLWGSTFLGIRIAVQHMPPLMMAGTRFLLAGALVSIWLLWQGGGVPMSWPKATLTGGLFTLGTHGIISTISQDAPSGSVAVLMATVPLMAATWAAASGDRPSSGLWLALLLGFGGVALLAWPGGTLAGWQALWLLGAAACWATGSVLTQRWAPGVDRARMASRQMLAGGALLVFASGIAGQGWLPQWYGLTALGAVAFLAIGGTIIAYFSYLFLMARTSVTKASSYTFVNPVVAVLLGAWLGGEAITARLLVATPFIVAAVVLTLRSPTPKPRQAEASQDNPCAAVP